MCLNIAAVLLGGDGTCVLRWYLRRLFGTVLLTVRCLRCYGDADTGDCCRCFFSFSSSSSSFWLLLLLLSVTFSFLLCPSNATTFV